MSDGYVCPKCGLDYDTIHEGDAKVAIRSYPRRYRSALAALLDDDDAEQADAIVRRRPEPEVWSALEYTAHVADVLGGMAPMIREMRVKDSPTIDFVDLGSFAAAERGELDAEGALRALEQGADELARELDAVGADEWTRVATFPWGERDILATTRNAVHEGSHHLRDVTDVLDAVRGRAGSSG